MLELLLAMYGITIQEATEKLVIIINTAESP
jgi:hypothetical protein